MSLIEIMRGWKNFIIATPAVKQMMHERLVVCSSCPYIKELSTIGIEVLTAIHSDASIYYCGACKCPLAGKTSSSAAQCPDGRWGPWVAPETYY